LQSLQGQRFLSPEKQLKAANNTEWSNAITQLVFDRKDASNIMEGVDQISIAKYLQTMQSKMTGNIKDMPDINPQESENLKKIHTANTYIEEANMKARALFNKAYKYGNEKEKEFLSKLSENYGKEIGNTEDGKTTVESLDPRVQSNAIFNLIEGLEQVRPEVYVSVEDFATEKSSETFANVALHSFKEHGDKAPIISIENLYPDMAFTTGEEMEGLIVKSRERFVEAATSKEKGGLGLSQGEAEKQAEKLIGMTFDVGHLNVMKKSGFTDEDLAKEAAQIAKFVKHIHVTDNFGYDDSHLPPGMGNVPFKQHFEELEKAGVLGKARMITEVGGWFEHFKSSPYASVLEAFGSPMISNGDGGTGPYWNQAVGLQQGYSSGYGMMLPQGHYQILGAGFSQLPSELGGQRQQGGGFSGQSME
jgi:hypothetical protein